MGGGVDMIFSGLGEVRYFGHMYAHACIGFLREQFKRRDGCEPTCSCQWFAKMWWFVNLRIWSWDSVPEDLNRFESRFVFCFQKLVESSLPAAEEKTEACGGSQRSRLKLLSSEFIFFNKTRSILGGSKLHFRWIQDDFGVQPMEITVFQRDGVSVPLAPPTREEATDRQSDARDQKRDAAVGQSLGCTELVRNYTPIESNL